MRDAANEHIAAALKVFRAEDCEDVLILGRRKDGGVELLTSYPEGHNAPLTQLAAEVLAYLSRGRAVLYPGREWVMAHPDRDWNAADARERLRDG